MKEKKEKRELSIGETIFMIGGLLLPFILHLIPIKTKIDDFSLFVIMILYISIYGIVMFIIAED